MMDIPDGITKWSDMDENSQRLDDYGNRLSNNETQEDDVL